MYTNHVHQGHTPSVHLHSPYPPHMPNGHQHQAPTNHPPNQPHPPAPANHRAQAPTAKERITVQAVPSVTVQDNQLVVGDSRSSSTRSYTPLKVVGDGSFGTVWLCDWHGTLPPNTSLSAMQCGPGARPEYAGKRLVAVKRMKKQWDGGWDECKKLKELESLRAIPYHPNIIPLYDFFLLPDTKELYFVFESMEGNLYQLIKARKGKPLAGGLVSSIFRQVVSGLYHIHESGYFHRDMKPENLLVTTTGLYDYRPVHPNATPDSPPESDVVVIVKLADFGLARETKSKPPYTEYVSTRWYRAPEVLLKSRDYSNPVDMWALGTIMAELVNLRPLFPGQGEVDQVARICEVLGDPGKDYTYDARGIPVGGGKWSRGVKMARAMGFSFPEVPPKDIYSLFDRSVPIKLVECIADLLKYDPDLRLTSKQCLEHPYLLETTPLNKPPGPPGTQLSVVTNGHTIPVSSSQRNGVSPARSLPSVTPRSIPPSHSHNSVPGRPELEPQPAVATIQIPDASTSHRTSFYDTPSPHSQVPELSRSAHPHDPVHIRLPNGSYPVRSRTPSEQSQGWPSNTSESQGPWDPMDVSPHVEIPPDGFPQSMDVQTSPMLREYPARPQVEDSIHEGANGNIQEVTNQHAHSKLSKFGFGKKTSKWGLGTMFGHGDKGSQVLAPVQENPVSSAGSTPSLKRTQSSSTDSRSLSELSPIQEVPPRVITDPKQRKKEAARIQRDAEKQRRLLAEKTQKEQARAVLEKSKRFRDQSAAGDFEWRSSLAMIHGPNNQRQSSKQPAAAGPIRQTQSHGVSSVDAAGGSFMGSPGESHPRGDWRRHDERLPKARRRDYDDDHSMSSTDMTSGVSVISFATVDSDPGPRLRHRPSALGISRMTSMSSLGTTLSEEFSPRMRSSTSLAMEQQFANDFHLRASVDSSSISDGGSPAAPPMHMLSLSSPIPWARENGSESTVENGGSSRGLAEEDRPTLTIPPQPKHPTGFQPQGPLSPYESRGNGNYPSSPGVAPKSAINPIFKVPPLSTLQTRPGSLPPFSQLEAVAEGEYPPLSPMSFTSPDDIVSDFS